MEVTGHTGTTSGDERRARSRAIVDQLANERAEMLVCFCRVAGVDPYDDADKEDDLDDALQEFCQILVDYLATGHFGLYKRIIDGEERRGEIRSLAEKLYPRIAETTEYALDFNDKYDANTHISPSQDFSDELSKLGQAIATRIELEDQLLDVMR